MVNDDDRVAEAALALLDDALASARRAAALHPCPETAGAAADLERRRTALASGRAAEAREAMLRRLRGEGATMREIAAALGLASPSGVHRQLAQLGLAGGRPASRPGRRLRPPPPPSAPGERAA